MSEPLENKVQETKKRSKRTWIMVGCIVLAAVIVGTILFFYFRSQSKPLEVVQTVAQTQQQEEGLSAEPTQNPEGQAAEASPENKPDVAGKININTASSEQLQELTGIGPALAQHIIDYRTKQPFSTIEEIKNVSGIGDKKFEAIKEQIEV